MKADRRHQLASNALARELEGLPDKLKRWGSTALTVFLVAAAVGMLIRWRMQSAEQSRLAVMNELANARAYVDQLRNPLLAQRPPDFVASARQELSTKANESISTVLNTSDDPKAKADALVTRGDLYWQLANFPELPGASTQPSLRAPESSDEYLKKSFDAYDEVLKNTQFAKQHDAVVSAHFGLAAIAENRRDWDEAKRHLDLIANDPDAQPALVNQAKLQLEKELPQMQTPLYVMPAATQPAATTQPTTQQASATTEPTPTTQPVH